ncbi:hypothetical protein [Falsiroseomonas tokyonensis]|uniref:Uncharacterized protein n=1 Tax=Falsiroseomonas tokyonensis TaxID=430521 RepID=A0ABV7BRH1_9PROT|nr:hypothetical protein [Falsiroseomonas tokyonensis]MBU8538130.1 hypothetical protein [Falsiroseomonas tokyonensis]
MRTLSKVSYWILGFIGTAVWTSSIIALTTLPLPAQLALGAMMMVGCLWGHSVLFPKQREEDGAIAPGRMPREEAMRSLAQAPLPLGRPRVPVARPVRPAQRLA